MARTTLDARVPDRNGGGAPTHGQRRGGRVLAVLFLAAGLLAGCGGDDDGASPAGTAAQTPPSQASPSAPTSASPSDGDDANGGNGHEGDDPDGGGQDADDDGRPQPPFPADTEPDGHQASADASGNITEIRIGHREGFDRVVFEFEGAGTPGWDVRYVDHPARQGSGEPVDLTGDATLQVTITGVGYPPDTGVQEYSGPRRFAARDTEIVTEVFFDGTFEGTTAALVGTGAERPFRAYLVEDPARIVLEVVS